MHNDDAVKEGARMTLFRVSHRMNHAGIVGDSIV
jgi:hypothetical protein